MDIVQDKLKVSISYTLKDNNGRIIEEVPEKHPFIYLHGFDNIIQGLEEALLNRHVDEKFTVKVPYEKGYGTYNKDLVLEVPKDELADIGELWLGLELEMFQEDDSQEFHIPEYPEQIYDAIEYPLEKETGIYTIKEIKKDTVVLDGNHPFAGMDLIFDVHVISVEEPSFSELENGIPDEDEEGLDEEEQDDKNDQRRHWF
ncbi:MAG: peptidylprolyl isomerase [Fibrobacter sp.]|jgi:FKBP-type peptidyl-prolyl cis-trans isomerase SlyD|nr:peptidylprolyl isomerase [Fibrobacter sp.]